MASSTAMDMGPFLSECERSGDSAYTALKSVLERLEDPATRSQARVFLADVQRRFYTHEASLDCFRRFHFRIHDVVLSDSHEGYHKRKKLTMMEIPSIFIPEDWSFTFYEGLNRHSDSVFKDKIIAELGCGNGWISIALADKWSPSKVYGLDINPRAVKVAWINLFLNAFDENGSPIFDNEKKTLLDRVEFYESDLLAHCRDNKIELDRIIGCIPQILNPNPEAMSKLVTENESEEFLYSLSNYCALQGFVEDQFGLGLIARAVEEGISVIKPMGVMVFNMGGRPGQAVCKRLFERRGFRISKLWQRKILQAVDTDISALVEIEKNSRHRFEFFMGLADDQPICARTAAAYIKSGGPISHSLSVYSCQLRQPNQVKTIFDFLKNGFQAVSSSLDFSFDDDSVADEKIPFLANLASRLKENSSFHYEPPAGSIHFRKLIAGFMKSYHHIPLDINNITVFPSRAVAIEIVLRLFSPRLAIVDEHLTRHLPKHWLTSLAVETVDNGDTAEDAFTVIEAPRQSDLVIELIKKLKPQVVITGMGDFEVITSSAFENLLQSTREIGSRLILDISDHLELSSLPGSNGVVKYLSENTLPSHTAILCGLIKNKVYSDMEVAFVISEEESVFRALSKIIEVLEGHTALFSQFYYGCLLHELLAFQITGRHQPVQRQTAETDPADMVQLKSDTISSLDDAVLSIGEQKDQSIIHMDVDQNFLAIPSAVKASIFESFVRQNMADSETDVRPGLQQLVKSDYGFLTESSSEFIYGNSPLALFNNLILCCNLERGTLLFPSGTNGNYVSAAKFMRVKTVIVPTQLEAGFKIMPKTLEGMLENISKPWLYISGPTMNPTGLLYNDEEIYEILAVCARFGARVIIDTSFSGLEFKTESWGGWDLHCSISKIKSLKPSFCVSLLGGLSFNMLTGELGFGFLVLNDAHLIDVFYSYPSLSRPHRTVRYAVKKLLGLREQKVQQYLEAIAEQKDTLKKQSNHLSQTLKNCGWDVADCYGGGSRVARPSSYYGKILKFEGFEAELSASNIREAVYRATGLCINSGSWTGIPEYCRFTTALSSAEFERALKCIEQFKKLVLD